MNKQRERCVNHIVDLIRLVADSKLLSKAFCEDPPEFFAGIIADRLLAVGAIFPPYKVGDTVWLWRKYDNKILKAECTGFYVGNGVGTVKKGITLKVQSEGTLYGAHEDDIFFTKEEAEKALKECDT